MLTIKNLTLAYGTKKLLEQATVQLYANQIVGLVGKNGTGKTSLFKLILGLNQAEAGDCTLPANTLISYIEQEVIAIEQQLVEYVLAAHHLYAEEYTDLPEYYKLRPRAEKLLLNLGFKETELNQPLQEFSGGWQMRANLAKALFCPSDLLLLDEPTNHLDIETVMWLESWLKSYSGLAIIISHDREFLDKVSSHTLHIANHQLTLYTGNYSTFERTRAEQLELEQKTASKTQAKVAHLQNFVDRFKAKASKAKQAQSRMKMIEKLKYSTTFTSQQNYLIDFYPPEYAADLLLTIDAAKIGYANSALIEDVNLQIYTNDRIGLLGRNGQGKTSLIKAIIDGTSLLAGQVDMNAKIKIGYFAQQTLELLDDNDTPFNLIQTTNKSLREQEVYNYLGRFGFSAQTSKEVLSKFSGGEKARLILAAIILTKPNILFLDEPTNHLDIQMREALAASLQDFSGAVILVSHDKFLLQSVVDDFYVIENKRCQRFSGSLDDYHEHLLSQEGSDKPVKKSPSTAKGAKKSRLNSKLLPQLQHEIQRAEKKLTQLGEQMQQCTLALNAANLVGDLEPLVSLDQQLSKLTTAFKLAEDEWLELQQQQEAV